MKTKVKFILTVLSVGLLLSMSISIGLLFRKSPRVFAADKEKAKIAFIIDDCYADNETYGTEDIIETFDTYGFKLGLAVITKWSANGNGISPTVMRHAYGNGHEILSHSVLHEQRWNDKSTYSSTEALREARNSRHISRMGNPFLSETEKNSRTDGFGIRSRLEFGQQS